MENNKTFFVSYYADETLPLNQCHKGLEKFSIRKRSRWFENTPEGKEQGIKFLK